MSVSKHTPGPWRVIPYDCGDRDEWPGTPSVQATEEFDCSIVHWAGFAQRHWQSARGRSEMEANARLIAAAPELLEALHWAITAVDRLAEVTPDGLFKRGLRYKAGEIRVLIGRVSATPSDTHEVG